MASKIRHLFKESPSVVLVATDCLLHILNKLKLLQRIYIYAEKIKLVLLLIVLRLRYTLFDYVQEIISHYLNHTAAPKDKYISAEKRKKTTFRLTLIRPVPNVVLLPCRTQMNLARKWHDDSTAAVSNVEPNTVASYVIYANNA